MNQEKIGKLIATCRKAKKMTQSELAEELGVTDRAISNWENGKNMPDLSLLKPLCHILDITINELLSGERLNKQEYQERLEENIVNTIDYSMNRMHTYHQVISLIFILFGLFISLSAVIVFPSESSWSSIYSVLGVLLLMVGIAKLLRPIKWYKRLVLIILLFIGTMGILCFADYLHVKNNHEAPMFRMTTTTTGNVIYYDTPFYDVYRCNFDEPNEYWIIDQNSHPTIDELINYCKE